MVFRGEASVVLARLVLVVGVGVTVTRIVVLVVVMVMGEACLLYTSPSPRD